MKPGKHYEFKEIFVPEDRARKLLERFIKSANASNPQTVTYADAFEFIFERGWSRGVNVELLHIAKNTGPLELNGLGPVCLDTFIVAQGTGIPGGGHWRDVKYNDVQWRKVFAEAEVLRFV